MNKKKKNQVTMVEVEGAMLIMQKYSNDPDVCPAFLSNLIKGWLVIMERQVKPDFKYEERED